MSSERQSSPSRRLHLRPGPSTYKPLLYFQVFFLFEFRELRAEIAIRQCQFLLQRRKVDPVVLIKVT